MLLTLALTLSVSQNIILPLKSEGIQFLPLLCIKSSRTFLVQYLMNKEVSSLLYEDKYYLDNYNYLNNFD